LLLQKPEVDAAGEKKHKYGDDLVAVLLKML